MSTIQAIATIPSPGGDIPALHVCAEPGVVTINGARFLPHEAAQLASALSRAEWYAQFLAREALHKKAG